MIIKLLVLVMLIPMLLLVVPNVYSRNLSNIQRYHDGFNDGSQAALLDRQNGNQFNPACDPTGAHTSDGQHTTTYCRGWSNGYTSVWNGNSGQVQQHPNNCCIYPRNPQDVPIFEHGLDDGTNMAKSGAAQPNYYDCIGDGGVQSTYGSHAGAYCSGVVQGYNAFSH